ncbi:MAG: bacillithiol biosynthesis cysteine-adding enzyme BshC, partial [Cyclobacteriaceae bacterium]
QKGAVGRFKLNDMQPLLKELPAIPSFFHQAYHKKKRSLADAVRDYINTLFGRYGLVILDADNRGQKMLFRRVMKADILDQKIAPSVRSSTKELEELGYSTQVNARDINFFYLYEQGRFRIERNGEGFKLVDGDKTFTREEIEREIESFPERFSPNVVLRPLYQEMILPNLAYIGGPSELVYWLQLKSMFEEQEVVFPILMPRNFGLVIPSHIERKRQATQIPVKDYFLDKAKLLNEKVEDHSEKELSLDEKRKELDDVFRNIHDQAEAIDITLGQHVEAQQAKLHKVLANMEKKFVRAEKRNHDDLVRQISSVREYIFPGGSLQERHDNFLNFYQNDPSFIEKLIDNMDPFNYRFNIFTYGE